jgi:hypothetical protein
MILSDCINKYFYVSACFFLWAQYGNLIVTLCLCSGESSVTLIEVLLALFVAGWNHCFSESKRSVPLFLFLSLMSLMTRHLNTCTASRH